MIVLEHCERETRNHFEDAGLKAEAELAHYLRREFEDDPRVHVYFGLRLPLDGAGGRGGRRPDAVQIDVLLVHRHGMAVVESKSVHDEVRINVRGEWSRTYRGEVKGMASPLEQAARQAQALRRLLIAHKGRLRERKLLGLLRGGFKHCPMELFVAISDKGRIVRPSGKPDMLPEVMKADQITVRVRVRLDQHRKAGSLIGMLRSPTDCDDGSYVLTNGEMERVRAFLLERHQA